MNLESIIKQIQGWAKIKGASDGTMIGNANNHLLTTGDAYLNLLLGNIPNTSYYRQFGVNDDIAASTEEAVWDGSATYPWPTAAAATTVKSTSTADVNVTGTGAWTVEVTGITVSGSTWTKTTETVNMNGTSAVNCSNNFFRVYQVKVITAGTGEANAGDITVEHSGTVLAKAQAGNNECLMAIYTVPSGVNAVIVDWHAEINRASGGSGTKFAYVKLWTRKDGEVFQLKDIRALSSDKNFSQTILPVELLSEKTDVYISAAPDTNNTYVTGGFEIIEVTT